MKKQVCHPVRGKCPRCKTVSTPVLRREQPWFCVFCMVVDLAQRR